jgi:hypothetical protein
MGLSMGVEGLGPGDDVVDGVAGEADRRVGGDQQGGAGACREPRNASTGATIGKTVCWCSPMPSILTTATVLRPAPIGLGGGQEKICVQFSRNGSSRQRHTCTRTACPPIVVATAMVRT